MWYERIADLYDGLVQFDDDFGFFLDHCRRADGPVVELMAGTGRLSLPLLEAGIDLTCVDLSEAMLAELRAKLARRDLSARIVHGDVRSLGLPADYALAILAFNGLSELVERKDRRAVFDRVRGLLRPGGGFLCTLHNPTIRLARLQGGAAEERRFRHPNGEGSVVFAIRCDYDPGSRIATGVQSFDLFSAEGEQVEHREVDVRFCIPERDELEGMAREAGFQVEALYGDYRSSEYVEQTSPYMIWMLRSRGLPNQVCPRTPLREETPE